MPQARKDKIEGTVYRDFTVSRDAIVDDDSRTIELSFSSEAPVVRQSWFEEPWVEVLGHKDGEANLGRLQTGAPLLYNHKRSNETRIGVVEQASLEKGRGTATVRLSKRNALMDEFWTDIRDGVLRNVSVGYQINERTLERAHDDAPDEYRVTRWTPHEISIVDIPADASVGVGRSENYEIVRLGGGAMPAENKPEENKPAEAVENRAAPAAQPEAAPVDTDAIRKQALADEVSRRDSVADVFDAFKERSGVSELREQCMRDMKIKPEDASRKLLELLGKEGTPTASVEMVADERDKFRSQVENVLNVRAGIAERDGQNELTGMTTLELARESLRQAGVSVKGLDKRELVGRAITHSSSDFPLVLANTAEKMMLKGYEEVAEVFDQFTSVGNLSDFKTASRVGLSEFGDLAEIKESGEYTHGSIGERREQITLATYGKMFSISRQALINDDLDAFTKIPRAMGRAARRKVGDLAWGVLTANAAMADGTALFHASHSNLAGTPAAMSVATLGAARAAMRKQTDSSGNAVLNIQPSLLLVPVALEDTAKTLMASETDFSSSNSKKPNILRNSFTVVSDARLDAASTTAWFLAAGPSQFDTIEIGYLDGNSNPFMEQQNGWSVDGVEFKVRIDAAAKALEHRTLYKNAGA